LQRSSLFNEREVPELGDMLNTRRAARLTCALVSTYESCGWEGCTGDATVTRAVQALFAQHPAIEAPNVIDVQTLNHVVYLYGLVDTELQRRLAESVAREAPGVARVVNTIGLRNSAR
jgi:osmotically-inducible protein OsmY